MNLDLIELIMLRTHYSRDDFKKFQVKEKKIIWKIVHYLCYIFNN